MTDLQKRVLELLKEIDRLCRENDIEFYLAAGSAIGAIRHRGFLPWDDDADIYMTSENFRKFYSIRDQFRPDRKLVTMEDDYSCGYMINRYADISTTRLYRYLAASPQPAGLIVDILVLDHVPDNEEAIRDYLISMTEFGNLLTRAALHTTRIQYDLKDRENWRLAARIGRTKALDELRKRAFKYDDTRGGVLIQRDPTVPHVWKEEIFGKPKYVPFEDTEMPVAEHYYDHLCGAFDEDWMYVPEIEDREQHWSGVILDISNNNPFNDYLNTVDSDAVVKTYAKYQKSGNFNAPLLKKQSWERLKLTAAKVRLHYRKHPLPYDEMEKMLAEYDLSGLSDYFSEYEHAQASRFMIGGVAVKDWLRSQKPFYLDVSDDFLYIFIRYYLTGPKLGKAIRILKARKEYGVLSDKVAELIILTEKVKELCRLMAEEQYHEAFLMASVLRERYPENMYILHIYFAAEYFEAEDDGLQGILDEIESLPEIQRGSDVIRGICAEICRRTGREDDALEQYRLAAEQSANGLLLRHICDVTKDMDDIRAKVIYRMASFRLGMDINGSDAAGSEDAAAAEEGE